MPLLLKEFIPLLLNFSTAFTLPSLKNALTLLVGTILCPGPTLVSTVLQVLDLRQEKRFEKFHRVLNRAKYSSLTLSKILLGIMLLAVPIGISPLCLGTGIGGNPSFLSIFFDFTYCHSWP